MQPLLAHAGPGASWQALVTVLSVLTAGLFVLTIARAVKITSPQDLVLPLAGVVIVSSLATSASATLSDQVGWALPVGVVAVVGLVLASLRPDDWHLRSPLALGAVIVAVVGSVALQGTLTRALHPTPVVFDVTLLPSVDDVAIKIIEPADDASVATPVRLVVEVTGGTIANERSSDAPADPEEGGMVRVLDGASILDVRPLETCSVAAPCTTLTYELDLAPGVHQLFVEFLAANGATFRTSVFDLARVTVA